MTAFFYVNSFSIFGKNELLKFFRNIFLLILFPFFSCTNRDGLNPADNSSEDSLSIYLTLANDFNLPKMERQKYNQKALLVINPTIQ